MADQAYRDKVYADNMAQQQLENEWRERTYSDSKKQEETDRVITLLENGIYNPQTASALLDVPVSQLNDFVNYIKSARNLELKNTQSLISNRNQEIENTKKKKVTGVFDTALAMSKEGSYTDDDIMRYVWGQGLSETEEIEVLSTLGLLNTTTNNTTNNTPVVKTINIRDLSIPRQLYK